MRGSVHQSAAQLPRLRNRDSFRAWLVRLQWRLALDRSRTPPCHRDTEHGRLAQTTSSSDPAIVNERAEHVWRAIDELPEKLRLALVLSGIEGHDIREISRLLGLPEGTVKSRLFHARERMKESLKWMI